MPAVARWSLALVLVLAAALAPAALAQPGEVVLRNGDTLRGEVTRTADAVVVEHATLGRLVLDPAQVAETRLDGEALSTDPTRDEAALAVLCGGGGAAVAKPWKLKGALAGSVTAGNTETLAIAAGVDGEYATGCFTWKAGVGFVYNESDGETTAERWLAYLRGEYAISWRDYVFAQVSWDRDEPAGLEYRFTGVAGYGHYFWKSDATQFKGEVGAGAIAEKWVDDDETFSPSLYGALRFEHAFRNKQKVKADLELYPNLNDWDLSYARLVLGYEIPMSEVIRLRLGLRLDYVVEPPGDKESLDTLFTVGLTFEV